MFLSHRHPRPHAIHPLYLGSLSSALASIRSAALAGSVHAAVRPSSHAVRVNRCSEATALDALRLPSKLLLFRQHPPLVEVLRPLALGEHERQRLPVLRRDDLPRRPEDDTWRRLALRLGSTWPGEQARVTDEGGAVAPKQLDQLGPAFRDGGGRQRLGGGAR